MPSSLFISYRRDDAAGHAGRLFDCLRDHFGGQHVFLDVTGIDAGVDFVETIEKVVGSCDVLLAVIGRDWLSARNGQGRPRLEDPHDFVRAEISAALRRKVRVVPVLMQDAAMPAASELPYELKALSRRHAHEIRDSRWDADVGALLASLDPFRRVTPWLRFAYAAIAVAVLTITSWFLYEHRVDSPSVVEAKVSPLVPQALLGEWLAEVTYPWNFKAREHFKFEADGNEIFGLGTFVESEHGLEDVRILKDELRFVIHSSSITTNNELPIQNTHDYRVRLRDGLLHIRLQITRAGIVDPPITFTAHRIDATVRGQ